MSTSEVNFTCKPNVIELTLVMDEGTKDIFCDLSSTCVSDMNNAFYYFQREEDTTREEKTTKDDEELRFSGENEFANNGPQEHFNVCPNCKSQRHLFVEDFLDASVLSAFRSKSNSKGKALKALNTERMNTFSSKTKHWQINAK